MKKGKRMKKILLILCVACLFSAGVIYWASSITYEVPRDEGDLRDMYKNIPSEILSETETHGRKHMRLTEEIPPDSEATRDYVKVDGEHYLERAIDGREKCFIDRPPSLTMDEFPCIEWRKIYDANRKLIKYEVYKASTYESDDCKVKYGLKNTSTNNQVCSEIELRYWVSWHSNGRVERICDYDHAICQTFDTKGQLIKNCSENTVYGVCETYEKGKWSITGSWTS